MAVEWKHSHSREQVKNTVRSSRKSSAVPLLTLYTHSHPNTEHHDRRYAPQTRYITSHHSINNRLFRVNVLKNEKEMCPLVIIIHGVSADPNCSIFVLKSKRCLRTHTPHSEFTTVWLNALDENQEGFKHHRGGKGQKALSSVQSAGSHLCHQQI